MCSYASSIGKGICYAGGGGTMCSYASSIGKGICYAGGGGTMCSYASSIQKGIDLFNKNHKDRDWAWDQFYHSTGSLVWACRGVQTGQFAEKYRCAGKSQNDYRWPNK